MEDNKLMKRSTEMIEGPEAFTRFEKVMKQVLSVPHSEIKRRIEEHRKEAALNPKKRGPKNKTITQEETLTR